MKMTLKTLEITWAEACCPPYTDASSNESRVTIHGLTGRDCNGIQPFIIACGNGLDAPPAPSLYRTVAMRRSAQPRE